MSRGIWASEGMRMYRKSLASLLMTLILTPWVAAQAHLIREDLQASDCRRYALTMSLEGEISFKEEGKDRTLPLQAEAKHEFTEKVLSLAKKGGVNRTARVYDTARATIRVNKKANERTLRAERNPLLAQWHEDQPLVYSLTGGLYQSELELCSEHFDTLNLTGLLPQKEVAAGDTWKISNSVVLGLCHFEGLIEHTLTGKLEKAEGGIAQLCIDGTTSGIELGAQVKMTIHATVTFDLKSRLITGVTWKQSDQREAGPASPASKIEMQTTITRRAVGIPVGLSEKALANVPKELTPPEQFTQMDYLHPKKAFDLLYTREWQIVSDSEKKLVLRLMERGDFVAQVAVVPLETAKPGSHMSPKEFVAYVSQNGGWEPEKTIQEGQVPANDDRFLYRVSQVGKLDGEQVLQNFYLATAKDGRQVLLAFAMMPKQVDKLGTRDLSLAGSLDFPKLDK